MGHMPVIQRRPALLALVFCICAISVHAQIAAFHSEFDAALARHGIVGGGFAFVHTGSPNALFVYGDARLDTHQPVTAATAYNWASITKSMTAIAILQLRDRGKLSLNDPAVKYIPELRQVHDGYGSIRDITIRHLLTHSA